ncbi:major facilitator superfamily domain-containing protein [Aspergillus falconensis]
MLWTLLTLRTALPLLTQLFRPFSNSTALIPILGLAFFALQIDRGNISAALTSAITEDLNITTDQINVGTQLLSAGVVISEIPSNVILQRVGPQRWLSAQLFAWDLVATFQAFIKSYPAYLVRRLLLGLLEGAWCKQEETSLRVTLFFFGQMFSGATSGLISAGLLTLSGKCGIAGWRWTFLVEGVMTLFIGKIFVSLVPPKAGDGRPLISSFNGRWSYLIPRESHIANSRITDRDIWNTVHRPRIIQHFFITLVAMSGTQGLTQYMPSMIKSFGFSAVRANALASVPAYCGMLWVLVLSYLSMHVLNIGWLSVYCRSPQERSVAMALVVMAANCAGISGSQIFRTEDKPL